MTNKSKNVKLVLQERLKLSLDRAQGAEEEQAPSRRHRATGLPAARRAATCQAQWDEKRKDLQKELRRRKQSTC